MNQRPDSEQCGLYLDLPFQDGAPRIGDILLSRGVRGYGSAYLVLKVRQVRRRRSTKLARFQMGCRRVEVRDAVQARTIEFKWYSRSAKKPNLVLPF